VIFDPRAHEPLTDAAWNPAAVEAEIWAIARDADGALRDDEWWPVHPLDAEPGDPDFFHGVYLGAAGVLWALDRLARAGLHDPGHDYARLAAEALESYRSRPELGGPEPSLFIGEGGIALVAWLLSPAPALADRVAELVTAGPADETLEILWGSPGHLPIAAAMLERTGEERWAAAWRAIAERLIASRGERVPGFWTQRLYGQTKEIVGAGHGMVGVVAALAGRPDLLAPSEILPATTAALESTAIRDGEHANWPARHGGPLVDDDGLIRTQWCHGAPGIVTSLASLPHDPALDELLPAGGELTWAAGPLEKGASLCHGTAGNGFALLKLFARTGDEEWLHRARRFAMHSAAQVKEARARYGCGRYSLWTGDPGTAVYLQQCLTATAELPTIELW
jgi:lantibiotic modifying enzyme